MPTQIVNRQIADGAINDVKISAGANIASTKLADGANFIKKDGSVAMVGPLNMGSQLITNVLTPSATTDATNKAYVDNLYNTFPNLFKYKDEVKAMMTTNVVIANPATAIFDGITLANPDRLLLTGQTAGAENGIYIFNGSATALTRATDADTFNEIAGMLVASAAGGTANAGKVVLFTNIAGGTLGTTVITSTVVNATPGLLTSNFVDKEIPSGAINSSNTTFVLANTPTAGSEHGYLNGILQETGAGNDYTITGATITYLTAPLTGDKLRFSYRK